MDDKLKQLMQELGNAINEALSDSERIAEAIGDIRQAGYDVFLVLEATIGFNKREDSEDEEAVSDSSSGGTAASDTPDAKRSPKPTGKIKLTNQDQKFLRALKISIDDES